jgi:hypothetical protein
LGTFIRELRKINPNYNYWTSVFNGPDDYILVEQRKKLFEISNTTIQLLYDIRDRTDNTSFLRNLLDKVGYDSDRYGNSPDMIVLLGIKIISKNRAKQTYYEGYHYYEHLHELMVRLINAKRNNLDEYYALLRERINYEDDDLIIPKGGKRIKRRHKSRRHKSRRNKSRKNKY